MPFSIRELYLNGNARYWRPEALKEKTAARRARYVQTRNALVKAIVDSGGRVLAGSDAPEWLMGYGWTLHRELASLVEAGLTPFQALRAATSAPADFLGERSEWGTIEAGKRADMVLVAGNPLEDIRNTGRIEGVALGGRWLDQSALRELIAVATRRLQPFTTRQ
jgi:imidazolonepropionase-like amidohydrolase